jgi:phosphate uptake regulator
MKLPKYKDVLKMGETAIKKTLAAPRAASAKKKAELEMCKIDEDIATKETDLHEECCKQDVSFPSIISLQNKIALKQREKKQYQMILDQMFPDE